MVEGNFQRRPLKSRSTVWAAFLSRFLTRLGVAPNAISFASVVFAFLGGWAFLAAREQEFPWGWWLGAVCIQLRLVCNLMDGMVAVEGGRKSVTGDLWNEVPDRFADVFFLVAAGVAADVPWLGVAVALGALLTAYIRALGASLTGEQDYRGPMAKPQRMALLTGACVVVPWVPQWPVMSVALAIMALGVALTCGGRLWRLSRRLQEKNPSIQNEPSIHKEQGERS